jgi:hypothetical protein
LATPEFCEARTILRASVKSTAAPCTLGGMERFSLALRIVTWAAAIVIVGAYVGWKICCQTHAPPGVMRIERGR